MRHEGVAGNGDLAGCRGASPCAAPPALTRRLPADRRSHEALRRLHRPRSDITLDVREGEFVCFLGPSGCGKTTLLRAIAGLDLQSRGSIRPGRADISTLPPIAARLRHRLPVLRAVPEPDDRAATSPSAWRTPSGRAPRSSARVGELLALVGLAEQAEEVSGAALRRPAAARRARPRARHLARPAAARRAALGARRQGARASAPRDQGAAARARRHHHHGHPRPGGGAVRWPTASW